MIFSDHMRDLYEGSGFYNVGDWSGGADRGRLVDACRRLTERHLSGWGSAPGRVLDAGCGLGGGTQLIQERWPGAAVIGINISRRQVAHARARHTGPRYLVMDAARMGFPDGCFDRVVSVEAAFHFSSRLDFLREAFRVLRPGGTLVLTDILFRTRGWTGGWLVPVGNVVTSMPTYATTCRLAGFAVDSLEDLTGETWLGFARYLRTRAGQPALAADLERAAAAYVLARLSRPGSGTSRVRRARGLGHRARVDSRTCFHGGDAPT